MNYIWVNKETYTINSYHFSFDVLSADRNSIELGVIFSFFSWSWSNAYSLKANWDQFACPLGFCMAWMGLLSSLTNQPCVLVQIKPSVAQEDITSRQMADWKIYIVITYACRCIVVNDSWCTQWRHILFFMYTPTHLGRQQHTYTRVRSKVTIFFSLFFGSIATSLLGRFSKLSRIFVISIHI